MSDTKHNSYSALSTVLYLLVPLILGGVVAYGYFTGISIQVILPILLVLTIVLLAAVFLILRSLRRRMRAASDDQPC